MAEQNKKKEVDAIKLSVNKTSQQPVIPDKNSLKNTSSSSIKLQVTDNKIPHRGVLWYILFTVIFLGSGGLIIYFQDWALLFFVVVFGGITLWRGHTGSIINLEINDEGIRINEKRFFFEQVESWYFSRIGDDLTITFQMIKKYLPRITFIFTDSKKLEQIRKTLGNKVPETEPREESFVDFFIRKLKI